MDDYLTKVFTQADIENYITGKAEESTYLEFKTGDAFKNPEWKKEMHKDISAFANADGGIIVYGIEEIEHAAQKLVFVDGNEFTKDRLEQVITSGIHRNIDGLVIDPIRFDDRVEQSVYVVKVPRSLNAPHQSSDKKFYKRRNFKVDIMEEYEIRDLYTRQDKTILEIANIRASGYGDKTNPLYSSGAANINFMQLQVRNANPYTLEKLNNYVATIRFDIVNKGRTIEKQWKSELWAVSGLIYTQSINGPISGTTCREVREFEVFSMPNASPLFQEEVATIEVSNVKIFSNRLADLESQSLIVKLFYSNGIQEKAFCLLDLIENEGKRLAQDAFQ